MASQKRLIHENGAVCLGGEQCRRLTHYPAEGLESQIVHETLHKQVRDCADQLNKLKRSLHTASQICKEQPAVHLLRIATVLVSGAERSLLCVLNDQDDIRATGSFIKSVLANVDRSTKEVW